MGIVKETKDNEDYFTKFEGFDIQVSQEEKRALTKILAKSPYKSISEFIFDTFGKTTGSFAQKNLIDNSRLISIQSLGLNSELIPLHRYVTIRLAISDSKRKKDITEKLIEFLKEFNIEVEICIQQKEGSWSGTFMGRTVKAKSSEEFFEDLKKAGIALAEIYNSKLEIVRELIKLIDGIEKVVIQVGFILVVKNRSGIYVRDLSYKEHQHIEENSELLEQPDKILEYLENIEKMINDEDLKRMAR